MISSAAVDDPLVVGQAIGAATVFAIIAFVVARKLCGPAGAGELARLKRISGVDELDPNEGRGTLLLRDWLPWVAGIMAAFVGFASAMVGE